MIEEMSQFHKRRKDCSVEKSLFPFSFLKYISQLISCFCTYLYSLILAVYPRCGRLNTNIISIKAGRRNYIIQAGSSAFHGTIRTRQRAFLWYSFSSYRRINRKERLREPSKSVWLNKSHSWTRAIAPLPHDLSNLSSWWGKRRCFIKLSYLNWRLGREIYLIPKSRCFMARLNQ